ncbi:GEVED domain-containing protein [Novipirellula sp.]|uniref:GEVED domain-containing protein n=1 Tax=Novipirellula sp. TaxID=2795430 RepID=UPI003569CA93
MFSKWSPRFFLQAGTRSRKLARRQLSAALLSTQRRVGIERLEDRHLLAMDFGDAPDLGNGTGPGNYQTRPEWGGPSHIVSSSLFLGSNNVVDDGIRSGTLDLDFNVTSSPAVTVFVTNITHQPAVLYGWVDFNGDGHFDNSTERASRTIENAVNAAVTLEFDKLLTGYTGETYARFRIGPGTENDETNSASFAFGAGDIGEVEDYLANVSVPVLLGSIGSRRDAGIPKSLADNDFGSSIAPIGDLDNNGVIDLAVGAPADDTGGLDRGAVHVLLRNADGSVKRVQYIASGMSGLTELNDGDHFGTSVATIGDLDGNGVTDLVVGAPGDATGGSSRGAIYLLYMDVQDDDSIVVQSSVKIASDINGFGALADGSQFGTAVSAAGDINGDNVTDLVVATGGTGRAIHVLLMNVDNTVQSTQLVKPGSGVIPNASFHWGSTVVSVGDIDGDLVPDLAVGDKSNSSRGAVDILFMDPDGTVRTSTRIDNPSTSSFTFGASLASIGDLDGDTIPDLLVGRDGFAGAVLLNSDGNAKHISGGAVGDGVVIAAASTGERNEDGYTEVFQFRNGHLSSRLLIEDIGNDDGQEFVDFPFSWGDSNHSVAALMDREDIRSPNLAIGDSDSDLGGADRGAVRMVFRSNGVGVTGTQTIASGIGGMELLDDYDRFGAAVASAGDLDNDGAEDLFVSAPGDNENTGAIYALNLNPDRSLKSYMRLDVDFSQFSGREFGTSIDVVGDMNGDQIDDLVVSSRTADGSAHLVHLLLLNSDRSGGTLQRIDPGPFGTPHASWGTSVAGIGDINGDQIPDLAVGAPDAGPDGRGVVDILFMNSYTTVDSVASIANTSGFGFGASVTSLGDLDGDEVPEIAVGGVDLVRVFFLEANGTIERQHEYNPVERIAGTVVSSLTLLNDSDDEGVVELAVASDRLRIDTLGRYISIRGVGDISPIRSISGEDFAYTMTSLGDLDGNGVVDIAMGAPGTNAVYVLFMGQSDASFLTPYIERATEISSEMTINFITGEVVSSRNRGGLDIQFSPDDAFAASVANIGDLDGDGVTDLAVTGGGSAYVLLLNADGSVKSTIEIEVGDSLIESVTGLGDIDGDGVVDLALGAPSRDFRAPGESQSLGGVHVLLMKPDGKVKDDGETIIDRRTLEVQHSDQLWGFGAALAAVGDVNQDGVTDLAVLEHGLRSGTNNGIHLLLLNPNGSLSSDQIITGLQISYVGSFEDSILVPRGDIDADGVPDLTVYTKSLNRTILFNTDGTVKQEIVEDDDREFSATAIGDLNDDGAGDILIGRVGNFGVRELVIEYPRPQFSLVGDRGDAPDSDPGTGPWNYNTLLTDDGPLHGVVPGLYLGASVSIDESDNLSTAADSDDDDGVVDPARDLHITGMPTIELMVTNEFGLDAKLYGWIDVNVDGVFDDSERVVEEDIPSGINQSVTLVFPELPLGIAGTTYARFRLSSDEAAASPTGVARNGEVEDYRVTFDTSAVIDLPDFGDAPIANDGSISSENTTRLSLDLPGYNLGFFHSIGDVDGDGINDLASSAVGLAFNDLPGVAVHLMNADGTVKQVEFTPIDTNFRDYRFGDSFTGPGDLNGDGVPDVVVGDKGKRGSTLGRLHVIFLNREGRSIGSTIIGGDTGNGPPISDNDGFGRSVAGIGDLNNDGRDDLVVGAEEIGGGSIYVLFMGDEGVVDSWTRIGDRIGANTNEFKGGLGSSVVNLGDLDDDDVTDLLVGAPYYTETSDNLYSGAAYVVFMNADGTRKSSARISQSTGIPLAKDDRFGSSVAAIGDVDDDGNFYIAVGAQRDDTGASNKGAVYVLLLNSEGSVKDVSKIAARTGGGPNDANTGSFGLSIGVIDDVNDNDLPELIVRASTTQYLLHLTRNLPGSRAPTHKLDANLFLGSIVDAEPKRNTDVTATGDDTVGFRNDEDGLVDPTQLSQLIPGEPVVVDMRVTNTIEGQDDAAGPDAILHGWIDFDGDHVFDPEEEYGFARVTNGKIGELVSITFPAPVNVVEGTTYARFRLSSDAAAAEPTGPAADGEIEDYSTTIQIVNSDYGDAPDSGGSPSTGSYNTLSTNNGPSHIVDPLIYLGSGVNRELEARPNASASSDMDDGLISPSSDLKLIPGQQPSVRVKVTNNTANDARLYGWIDYNSDGVFANDPETEQSTRLLLNGSVVKEQLVIPAFFAGNVELQFAAVPAYAAGHTFARFRLSTDGTNTGPTGPATDGEVEDYRVTILANDYGDAPASFNLTSEQNIEPPSHRVVEGLTIGATVDRELSGFPTPDANSDDRFGEADEDGLVNPLRDLTLVPGLIPSVELNVTNNTEEGGKPYLYGWIDVDQSGSFDSSEMTWEEVGPGTTSVILNFPKKVPKIADGKTYARFRLTTDPVIGPTGMGGVGEVEDYVATVVRYDFGDAPDKGFFQVFGSYSTERDHLGPYHLIDQNLTLGALIDVEEDATPIDGAVGDDSVGLDDEDGLINPQRDLRLTRGIAPRVEVQVRNDTGKVAWLYGWIDINANGVFEDWERKSQKIEINHDFATTLPLEFDPVTTTYVGETYARFRISTDQEAARNPTGGAPDGEVEDYLVTIVNLDYGDAPDIDSGTDPGNYNTRDVDLGPTHNIVDGLHIGSDVDNELDSLQYYFGYGSPSDGTPRLSANGDDQSGSAPDDEDGLVDPVNELKLTVGKFPKVHVNVTSNVASDSGNPAWLYGWIDYNRNGHFDNATEFAAVEVPFGESTVELDFGKVPNNVGTTYARFRLTTDGEPRPTGYYSDGEVEDYVATISLPADGSTGPTEEPVLRASTEYLAGSQYSSGAQYGASLAFERQVGNATYLWIGAPGDNNPDSDGYYGSIRRTKFDGPTTTATDRLFADAVLKDSAFGSSIAILGVTNDGPATALLVGVSDGGYEFTESSHIIATHIGRAKYFDMNPNGSLKGFIYGYTGITEGEHVGAAVAYLGTTGSDIIFATGSPKANALKGELSVWRVSKLTGNITWVKNIGSGTSGMRSLPAKAEFGSSIALVGKTGSKYTLAVGAPGGDGAVYLIDFDTQSQNVTSSKKITAPKKNTRFGGSVTAVGDLNDDGVTDLAVGSPKYNKMGALHLLMMNQDGTYKPSPARIGSNAVDSISLSPNDQFGASLAFVGIDNLGFAKLAVGAPGTNGKGAIYLLSLETEITPNTLKNAVESVPGDKSTLQTKANAQDFDEWVEAIAALPEFPRPNEVFTVTLNVESGVPYKGVTFDVPPGYKLVINGTGGQIIFRGASPALTVASGDVLITGGVTFTNDTDAPTILVVGGSLTIRDAIVQETNTASRPAIQVIGGTLDLGTSESPGGNTLIIHGAGNLIDNAGPNPLSSIGNTFQIDGVAIVSEFDIEAEITDYLDGHDAGLVTYVTDTVFDSLDAGTRDLDLLSLVADLKLANATFVIADAVNGEAAILSDDHTVRFVASELGAASFRYSVRVDDDEVASRNVNFDITNLPPSIAIEAADIAVNEGETLANTGTFSDSTTDTVTLSASIGTLTTIGDSSGTWYWSLGTSDSTNEIQWVTITASDGVASASTKFTFTVNNVAVSFDAGSNAYLVPVDEGYFERTGISFTDPGADEWSGTVNFGDGTAEQPLIIDSASKTFDLNHVYTSEGEFTVTVRLKDDDSDFVSDTFEVSVILNQPPVANNDLLVINEDDSLVDITGILGDADFGLLGNDADPDGDSVTIVAIDDSSITKGILHLNAGVVTFDPNNEFDPLGTGETESQSFSYTIADPSGETSLATATIEISGMNDWPTIIVDKATVSVQEGRIAENQGLFSDLDASDIVSLHASIGAVIDNEDGSWSWSWNTQDGPIDSAQVIITASDGRTESTDSFELVVENHSPEFTSLSTDSPSLRSPSPDRTVELSGRYGDSGLLDTHAVMVDWGDGTQSESIIVDQLENSFGASHTYASGGFFPITVTLADDDGATVVATTTAAVQGVGLVDGKLWVIGTDGRDDVKIDRAWRYDGSGWWWYPSNWFKVIEVDARLGQQHVRSEFAKSDVDSIEIVTLGHRDRIDVKRHVDRPVMIDAGPGDDRINVDSGTATVFAGPGRDRVTTASGDDFVDGGEGNDAIWTDSGNDTIVDMDGDNEIRSGSGDDSITTGEGDDRIWSGNGNDVILVSGGNNWVDLGDGEDVAWLGAGNDHVSAGRGNDLVFGGEGDDHIDGDRGDDILVGGGGNDRINGDRGLDLIIGCLGADRLDGGRDDDLLIAGWTIYDDDRDALDRVLSEWAGNGDYVAKVGNLRSGIGNLPYGQALHAGVTVFEDEHQDRLEGSQDRDWYFSSLEDNIKRKRHNEFVDVI